MNTYKLAVIGAGNMAEGIVAAAVRGEVYLPNQIIVADPVEARRDLFVSALGVAVTEDNAAAVRDADAVMIAVKPQMFADVFTSLAGAATNKPCWISIMAGLSTVKMETVLGNDARIVRVMPNLPIRVNAGVAGICAGQHATTDDVAETQRLFDAGGSSVVVDDEGLMDAVTAVSGSGPAYFYNFVEQMIAGGMACGLTEAEASTLARYTCLGAAKMMLESDDSPAELRQKVTSKGGTTQAALEHMAASGVNQGIVDAVKAAFARGRELGG